MFSQNLILYPTRKTVDEDIAIKNTRSDLFFSKQQTTTLPL